MVLASFFESFRTIFQKSTSGPKSSYPVTLCPLFAKWSSIEPPPKNGEQTFCFFDKLGMIYFSVISSTALDLPPGYRSGDRVFTNSITQWIFFLILSILEKNMTFAQIVKDEFSKNKTRTLKELYDALDAHPDVSLSGTTLKHRIRSALYGLKQAQKVELISKATYSTTKKF